MSVNSEPTNSFQLPPEVLEICDLAENIVSKELMPLEAEFLNSSDHAFGIKETLNLEAVFGKNTLDHLMKIAKENWAMDFNDSRGIWWCWALYVKQGGYSRTILLYRCALSICQCT